MPYTCDTCGRIYGNKSNLCRHIKEKHNDGALHFSCIVTGCKSKFIRRSYLTKHISLIHKMEKKEAKSLVSKVVLETGQSSSQCKSKPPTETCQFEDISDDDNIPGAEPAQTVADNDFDNWLNEIVDTEEIVNTEEHKQQETTDTAYENLSLFDEEPTLDEVYDRAEEELETINTPIEPVSVKASDADDNTVTECEESIKAEDGDEISKAGDELSEVSDEQSGSDATGEEVIDISSDDEGEIEEQVEFFNVTLKTTTKYRNQEMSSVDRVVSVAYSNDFDPRRQDPMEVFKRIQQAFVECISNYKN